VQATTAVVVDDHCSLYAVTNSYLTEVNFRLLALESYEIFKDKQQKLYKN